MALQDSVHSYNLSVDDEKRIHICIAANRGEIRVTDNDIFGEPINISSRIESITPTDEIYLSESLYSTINKSKVPAQEVGLKELSGDSKTTLIYNIPRYLMPQLALPSSEQGALYPYGGMHYLEKNTKLQILFQTFNNSRFKWAFIAAPICLILLFVGIAAYNNSDSITPSTTTAPIAAANNPYLGQISDQPVVESSETAMQVLTNILSSRPKLPEPTVQVERKKSYKPKKSTARRRGSWNITTAKSAYRSNQLSKASYKQIVYDLKINYKSKIRRLKSDYKSNKITKTQYKQAVTKAKHQLKGR